MAMNDQFHFKVSNFLPPAPPITSASLCTAFSTVATRHAKKLGILSGFDANRDCGWVILTLNLRVFDTIPVELAVDLETWIAAIEGPSLIREFRMSYIDYNGKLQTIAEATQSFVLFDRTTRKVSIPPREKREEFKGEGRKLSYTLTNDRRIMPTDAFENTARTSSPSKVFKETVSAHDLDVNGHLNNVQYLRWLSPWIDSPNLPDQIGREVAIEFLREAKLDDTLEVQIFTKDPGSETQSFAIVDDKSGELSAYAKSAKIF